MMRCALTSRQWAGALFVAVSFLTVMSQAGEVQAAEPDGKEVFLGQKCNLCHSVEAAGIEAKTKSEKLRGPDLTGVTKSLEPAWIARYLKREERLHDGEHKKEFTGTDEELQALIDWLDTLQAGAKDGAGADSGNR